MQCKAPDVDTYIAEAPPDRQDALKRLQSLCRGILAGYDECIAYGMPVYQRAGSIDVGFASQKRYIALYILKKDVVDEHRAALSGCSVGKGCIRFSSRAGIDFDVVASILRRTAESASQPC